MSTPANMHEDDSALAAEYALGLLNQEEARLFEARVMVDADLQAEVARWQESFAALTDDLPPVTPPAKIKANVERYLFGATVVAASFSLLRFLGYGTVAALIGLTVFWFVPRGSAADFRATLASADQALKIEAAFDKDKDEMTVMVLAGGALPGRSLELWVIPQGATVPVALGVLPDTSTATVVLTPELAALIAGGTLAISDEPPGGSPTGQPTGAVLATGVVQEA